MQTEEERTAQDIIALGHSLSVIAEIVAFDLLKEQELNRLSRNVRHLEIMLEQENILSSGIELTPFQDAIIRGRAILDG